jgi:transposase InsO family protein
MIPAMSELFTVIAICLSVTLRLSRPGGARAIAAEMIILRTQLMALKRKEKRSPPLTPFKRLLLGFTAGFVSKRRLSRVGILIKPATFMKFHRSLVKRKYRELYSNRNGRTGRPRIGDEIRILVTEIKKENPSFGCPRIALTVADRTGVAISEETVRRILRVANFGLPDDGPSWLSFLGSQIDSLWSVDMFKAESILLKTHWVMVVMDQCSRKIIGFASMKTSALSGENICALFNRILGVQNPPKRLSHDHDPLFHFHRWQSNMSILDIEEIWSVPHVPKSHPFVERLIGTTRREFLDHTLFWNQSDLDSKLREFQGYFNEARVHQGISGECPSAAYSNSDQNVSAPANLSWKSYCRGLYKVPVVA